MGGEAFAIIVLLIFGVMLVQYVTRKGQRTFDASARQAILNAQFAQTAPVTRAVSLDVLRQHDPALNEADVMRRVAEMSRILREAWCSGDMRPARPFVSDGIFSRFQVQLALMAQEGVRNVMSDASVLYSTIEAVESQPPFDVIHVRFTGQARDLTLPMQTPPDEIQRRLARAPLEQYVEIWSLIRRHGASTKLDPAKVGHACPKCGAPMDGGEMIVCKYCKALVCSGEYDWVLAEITQVIEWHPSSHQVTGLDQLRQDDPGVAQETVEDRASYLFWKWIQASREGNFAKLRKCASPAFERAFAGPQRGPVGVRDIAVGGSDLLAVDPGGDGGIDYAYVKVYWSAAYRPDSEPVPSQSVLRLMRKSGAQSTLAMSALVCRACGAPLSESDSTRCDHCNAELAAGDQAWVLDGVEPPGQMRLRQPQQGDAPLPPWLFPNIADPRERNLLFAGMAAMVAVDGKITRRERRFLSEVAHRWSVPRETVDHMLANPPTVVWQSMASTNPQWFLAGLVSAALIDGTVDVRERGMLERACAQLRLPREELDRQLQAGQMRMRGAG